MMPENSLASSWTCEDCVQYLAQAMKEEKDRAVSTNFEFTPCRGQSPLDYRDDGSLSPTSPTTPMPGLRPLKRGPAWASSPDLIAQRTGRLGFKSSPDLARMDRVASSSIARMRTGS